VKSVVNNDLLRDVVCDGEELIRSQRCSIVLWQGKYGDESVDELNVQ
jgi:hypothetical protein